MYTEKEGQTRRATGASERDRVLSHRRRPCDSVRVMRIPRGVTSVFPRRRCAFDVSARYFEHSPSIKQGDLNKRRGSARSFKSLSFSFPLLFIFGEINKKKKIEFEILKGCSARVNERREFVRFKSLTRNSLAHRSRGPPLLSLFFSATTHIRSITKFSRN